MDRQEIGAAYEAALERLGDGEHSPWAVLGALVDAGLLLEQGGFYIQPRKSDAERVRHEREDRKRAENRDRVQRYRDKLRENGDATGTATKHRAYLMKRDGSRCVYCGDDRYLVVEHMLPVARGGRSDRDNLVMACRSCNSRKLHLTPSEVGFTFMYQHIADQWARVARTIPSQSTNEGLTGGLQGGDSALHGLQPYTTLTAPLQSLTGGLTGGLQGEQSGVLAEGHLPHHNAENRHLNGANGNGAYKEQLLLPPPLLRSEEEVLSDQASASSYGGSGGVDCRDQIIATLHSIAGFKRSDQQDERREVATLENEFPSVKLLEVARDYAGAELTQPASWRRFRKWVINAANRSPPLASGSAKSVTTARAAARKSLDFS